jgi:hypothetical protein
MDKTKADIWRLAEHLGGGRSFVDVIIRETQPVTPAQEASNTIGARVAHLNPTFAETTKSAIGLPPNA